MTQDVVEMKWSELLARSGLQGTRVGSADPVVRLIVEDSRAAQPGSCFVAMRGAKADGHRFIDAAIAAGAVAVVCEWPTSLPSGVAGLILPSARGAAGFLGAALYGLDSIQRKGRLKIVGITGTNGKSTFCFLLRSILKTAGYPSALLGTIEYDLLSRRIDAELTTPPAATLTGYLAEAAAAGATHAAMEVSSIALDQGRCDGIEFAVGVFSNLTGDHLDYHGTMESYLAAKKRLFDRLAPESFAVTNADDEAGERIVADCRARHIRYALVPAASSGCLHTVVEHRLSKGLSLCADVHDYSAEGTHFTLLLACDGQLEECVELQTPLVGRHNVQNCLAAAGAAVGLGLSLKQVVAGLRGVTSVPGRLQRVVLPDGILSDVTVLVDYAHTDDALANVLSALRPLTRGRLIVLFGCGGDRDPTKRPRMARVAAEYGDRIVVTSDNPRTEDPQVIIQGILSGFDPGQLARVLVEPDRRRAIVSAIAGARPGDVVLLAGKGHENYQIIGEEKLPFDDAQIAASVLACRYGSGLLPVPGGHGEPQQTMDDASHWAVDHGLEGRATTSGLEGRATTSGLEGHATKRGAA